ncbi:MAG TPA: DUF350 domain-containing protein [Sulfurimonas sp. UBA12504]|nr:MAG: hypothetical protein A2019_02090 [Sulfurimonas sp. GWF2_37_8]DAB30581.1 MAG TPA: DUF350 domain-containing protein [Sulfurimonas sp. UBA12504]
MFLESFLFFLLFFFSAAAILLLFIFLYAKVTPYDDYQLIFRENNAAAAVAFGGAILGLCIPLYSALVSSVSYVDFLLWAMVAMGIQLLFAFVMIRINVKFSFEKLLEEGVVSVGVFMAFLSLSIGLLNAGSMSY